MTTRDRRAFLAASGTVLAAGLAGCGGVGGSSGGADASGSGATGGQQLSDVTVLNRTETTQTVDLRVARGGKVVYWARHDLAAQRNGGNLDVSAPADWDAVPGDYVVELHQAGDDGGKHVTRWETSANPDSACATLLFAVTDTGISVWTGKNECGAGGGNQTNATQ